MTDIKSKLKNLSPEEKKRLLAKLLQSKQKKPKLFPTSFAQQRLWFLQQLDPGSTAYNLPAALELTGNLNIDILADSINKIIQRHEILRTAFVSVEDKPQQRIVGAFRVRAAFPKEITPLLELPIVDLQNCEQQDIKVKDIIDRQIKQSFNLEQAPLLRTQLLQLETNKYILIFTLHHIITDYYSMRVLIKELTTIYQTKLNNKPSPLPKLELQYVDFSVWQHKWLNSDNLKTQLDYWQKQLANAPTLLDLPTDYPRPQRQTFNGAIRTFNLPSELSQALQSLSRQSGTTLFMTLLAGFQTLLYRYTQQSDILVASTVANRDKKEISNLIGLFVNNIIFRTKFEPKITFRQLLKQVKETALSAYEHQDLPYEYLVEKLQPERNLSHNPLFQVMFVLHNTASEKVELSDLSINHLPIDNQTARFDLSLDMYETQSGLIGSFEYNTDLLKAETIDRLVSHFEILLTEITANLDLPLTEIDYLTAAEKQQLLGNVNLVNYPQDCLVHELVENVIEIDRGTSLPKKTALIAEYRSFTYVELNEKANQLAHYLHSELHKRSRSAGYSQSTFAPTVGIFLNRDSDLIISLLAVLKTGAAYIPLDPSFPVERINYIIDDAKISFLITKDNIDLGNLDTNLLVINLDREEDNIQSQSTENLNLNIQPQDLAYVIYTSGSTGKPKGVAVQHNSLLNFLYSMQQQPGISENDTLLAVTTISFDIAALEIYLPLITGATIILASQSTVIDADLLGQKIAEYNITIMQATPASWRMLLDNNWQGKPDLKILCGGEALPQSLATELEPRCQEIWNLYGPTETTIWSSIYKYSQDNYDLIPIGKAMPLCEALKDSLRITVSFRAAGGAIANTQFYILDSQLNLVPSGIPGELYIGGAGTSRGYLNRPELTAERFIPNPFVGAIFPSQTLRESESPLPQHHERLYKTGDRVRQLHNGNLEYLGRLDNQIKIRGYRIELGEIEAVLNQYPQIQTSVVVTDNERLIAYCIPKQADVNQIRGFLQQKLPSYTIPGTIISLESFPLTPNGKIDRQALPLPDALDIQEKDIQTTPTEEILLGIWTQILDRNQIGIDSNFFELGGHSLLATRVISQVRAVFSIELPLRSLFEHPTIKDLAQAVTRQQSSTKRLVEIEIISRESQLPLSFAQQRQWFLHQLEPNNPAYNISTAVKITGKLDIQRLQQCLDILVQRQEILQTAFLTVEGKPQLQINPDSAIALDVVDLTTLPQTERQLQIQQLQQEDSQTPFVLEQSPLLRVKLLLTAAAEQILLLSVHHIIADGWSMGVLVKEIVGLYLSRGLGETVGANAIRPIDIQYVDYAAWQRKWLQGDVLQQQLDYWQQQLQNAPVISSFPTDNFRKAESVAAAGITRFEIDRHTTKNLQQISRRNRATLFMTVLSALYLLLHRYTGNDDLVIGTAIANRNLPEVEDLIGLFANTLALRSNLSNNPSFSQLLTQVRETTLAAYAHSDLPFEQLVDRLELERSLSYSPLFQIFLVWETQSRQTLEVEDLTWSSLPRQTASVAKFDLTIFLTETATGIDGAIEYNTALYDSNTIARITRHFQNLLTSIASNPAQPISEINFIDSVERKQLLEEFNRTQIDSTPDVCLHQLFEAQAKFTPNAPAIAYQQQQLTYAQLNTQADSLACYLQSLGVQSETKIGVMCDRHLSMIIALLAILKAGGCYIPLDPKYPQQRLDYILEDTQLNILLTETKYKNKFGEQNLTIIEINSKQESNTHLNKPVTRYPLPVTHQDNLAYIIYTSGSTGKPKGVAIAHRSAVTLCHWAKNTFSQAQLAGVLASTSICFDLSVFEIFVILSCGGAVILAENALELPSLNPSIPITLINTVPSAARELVRINAIPETVNTVNLAGEALPKDLVDKLYRLPQIEQVYNLYGPTEDTTYSTFTLTKEGDNKPPTIGNAIANTQTYILDKYLQPLPIGVPGELYLAGDGLARGYYNRRDLTAEKFIPNPFVALKDTASHKTYHGTSLHKSSRLYKTGDLARYLSSGEIEYLGRIDNQIKLRGFRIELGEIETALSNHPDVETAIVINRGQRLVAYVIAINGKNDAITGKGISRSRSVSVGDNAPTYLQTQLPEYMIPAAFVVLDKLPLTPNGKIDKKSLPNPEFSRDSRGESRFAPQNETEAKLVKIWQELLGIPEIGTKDNFFSLGGDSILAIQVIAKASQVGIKLTPKNLFQYQTIAELATIALVNNSIQAEPGIVTGTIPLTPIQHWFFEQYLDDRHHWNQSIWLEAKEPIEINLLEKAIAHLFSHHDALRLSFRETESGWLQTNNDNDLPMPLVEIDLAKYSAEDREIERLKIVDRLQASFVLESAPLIKVALFRLGNKQADKLLIIAHHLIIDGISWRIILEDLQTIYQQLKNNNEIQLPPKTTSWKQWSKQLQNIDFKSELNYWMEQKNKCRGERLFAHTTVAESKTITIALNPTETQQLIREVPEAYQTQINDVLLTALSQTWAELYNNNLLIELEGHGREDIINNVDISRTVGWFTTIYPLVLSCGNNIEESIKSIKEQIRAVPNRGISYGILRYLDRQKELEDFPAANIRFNYLGQSDRLFPEESLFYPISNNAGKMRSPKDKISCAIEIDSIIYQKKLKLKWTYSNSNYSDREMEKITQTYLVKLQKIIQHCRGEDAGGYTPSDFGQMDFGQDELDDLLDDL